MRQEILTRCNNLHSLSTEMISPQVNHKLVKGLTECFTDIDTAFKANGYSTNKAFLREPANVKTLEKIEKLVKDELGFKIFIRLQDDYCNFSIATISAPVYNIHDPYADDYFAILEEEVGKKPDEYKGSDYSSFYNSYKAFEKAMNTTGVVIDDANAKIKNLPDTYTILIMLDIVFARDVLKVSAKEMTAMFLHELGHGYTAISLSYRTAHNTSSILDAIQDQVIKKNKSVKDALIFAYKTSDVDIKNIDTKNAALVMYEGINDVFKHTLGFDMSMKAFSDVEAVADQFVARFGMGGELAAALEKTEAVFNNAAYYNSRDYMYGISGVVVFLLYAMIFALLDLASGMALASIAAIYGPIVIIGIIIMLAIGLVNILTSDFDAFEHNYDQVHQRIARVRNDLIRQLRLYNIDKEYAKALITQIDGIATILKKIPKEKESAISKVARFFSKGGRARMDAKVFEELIEDLMENSLHVSAARFKTL